MERLFGTDGVRGIANQDLSPELAFNLGRAGAEFLSKPQRSIVVGRDTRQSGTLLEAALVAGICSTGTNVVKLGVVPSGAVSYLTMALSADAGVVISASHNPFEYNGIKFFDRKGFKLSDQEEDELEAYISSPPEERPAGKEVGSISENLHIQEQYIDHVVNTIKVDLQGIRVAVDCSNGASYLLAPRVLKMVGAEVYPLEVIPDGTNINAGCGSTHPRNLQDYVKKNRVDIGLAFDGDADRLVAVDEKGNLVDGDFIMSICALALYDKGELEPPMVVTTVMTNMGFDLAMKKAGIEVIKTKVGDRYVLMEMLKHKVVIGGEQSGHIIFFEHSNTGDGLITALQLIAVMKEKNKSLSELSKVMVRLPQVLVNVKVTHKDKLNDAEQSWKAVEKAEGKLGGKGRVLVRPSGTEPLVRVMVEAESQDYAEAIAQEIADIIEKELG